MAINIDDLTGVVGLLECGEVRGTAFLLNNDTIATCRHCVLGHILDKEEVRFTLRERTIVAVLAEPAIPVEHDTVFLRLSEPVEGYAEIPLVASHLPRGLEWEGFGYPGVRGRAGMVLGGTVARSYHDQKTPRDVELAKELYDPISSYDGFSGSPLIIEGSIRGIIQARYDGGLGAISLARLQSYLEAASVEFRAFDQHDHLPEVLRSELAGSIPNWNTLGLIEEALARREEGYLLLSGAPGAGKSLLVAGFTPTNERMFVIGRYFAGGQSSPELPPAYHRMLSTFAQWLGNEASLKTKRAVAVRPDAATSEFARSVAANLKAIGEEFTGGNFGVLFIDGVEVGGSDDPPGFLEYLPPKPPPGIAIVLTSAAAASLSRRHDHLVIRQEIATMPLPLRDCERLIARRLGGDISISEAARIAELTEGNPLALTYYVGEYSAARARGDGDVWVALQGGPDEYYQRIWNRYSGASTTRYLLTLVARLRGSISEDELFKIVPVELKADCGEAFETLGYLFRNDEDGIRFYHESFRDFLLAKTRHLDDELHQSLAEYCESVTNSDYGLSNRIYHLSRSSYSRANASSACSQPWLDKAAHRCVNPDLLMSDLESILRDRLSAGDYMESIRLLLLRSRIHYRYNNIFLKFASKFAQAAVILRPPSQSLRFVVRHGHLVCSSHDMVSILRSLVLGGHANQAERLYRELRTRFWADCESSGVNLGRALDQLLSVFVFGATGMQTRHDGTSEIYMIKRMIREHAESSSGDDSGPSAILPYADGVMNGEVLWSRGIAITRGDDPLELAVMFETADQLRKRYGPYPFEMGSLAIPEEVPTVAMAEIGEALERAASASRLEDLDMSAASVLMRSGRAFDLVARIVSTNFPIAVDVNLRAENGVDKNASAIRTTRILHELAGYLAQDSIADRLNYQARHEWERRLIEAISILGRLNGSLYRLRSLNQQPAARPLDRLRDGLFPLLDFTLAERARWEESYHLPEDIVPEILEFAASILAEHQPSDLQDFGDAILDHSKSQFGLYIEGYMRVLASVADAVSASPEGVLVACDLRRRMSKHITKCVFARQERVEGLLDCAQHLARLGDVESAEEAFKDAIDSSLGPNWYKEDQYSLILDALSAVEDAGFSRLNWKSTVEVLAYASGESNFQRYVRDAKGSLIGHLSRSGLLAESLDLYLHYLLPSYQLQATRIRQVEVDKISDLSGLRFGIQEVDEQRAALELIDGLQDASPLRRWAILELFWPWGDDRHWGGFIDILCHLLAVGMPQVIGERFLRFLRSEVSPDRRAELAGEIRSRDSLGHAAPWLDRARSLGILDERDLQSSTRRGSEMAEAEHLPPDRAEDAPEGDLFLPGVFGRLADYASLKGAVPQAQKRISRQDARSARAQLTDCLRRAQSGGWSIWDGSEEAKNALTLLLTETGSIESGLAALAEIVMAEEYAESWRIARRLMTIIMPGLDLRQRQAMFALASEHVQCLVAPERKNFSVSDELDALGEIDGQLTSSECADRWLVSLLGHPNCYMRERTALILEWLAVRSEFDVRLLIDRIACQRIGDGKEIAIGLSRKLSETSAELVGRLTSADKIDRLREDPNFLVGSLAEDVLGMAREVGGRERASHGRRHKPLASSFDPEHSALFELEEGSDERAEQILRELCDPFTSSELAELIDIRGRAFGDRPPFNHPFLQREAIFRALGNVVDGDKKRILLESSTWNPMWPDGNLSLDQIKSVPAIVAGAETSGVENQFQLGHQTILHYFDFKPPVHEGIPELYEIIAGLVSKYFFLGRPNIENFCQQMSVFDDGPPPHVRSIIASIQEPAVVRFTPEYKVGGHFTPAIPSERLLELSGQEGFDRITWKDGRRWDLWGPGRVLSQGTALMADTSKIRAIQNYELTWLVIHNEVITHAFHQRRGLLYRRRHEG